MAFLMEMPKCPSALYRGRLVQPYGGLVSQVTRAFAVSEVGDLGIYARNFGVSRVVIAGFKAWSSRY